MRARWLLLYLAASLRTIWLQVIFLPLRTMPIFSLAGRGDFVLPLTGLRLLGFEAFEDDVKHHIQVPSLRVIVLLRFNEGWKILTLVPLEPTDVKRNYERALAKWVPLATDLRLRNSLILLNNLACLKCELAKHEPDRVRRSQLIKLARDDIERASGLLQRSLNWFRESERMKVENAVKQNGFDITAQYAA